MTNKLTGEELAAFFNKAAEHIPPAPPQPQGTRLTGVVRVRTQALPDEPDAPVTVAYDAALLALAYLQAGSDDERLQALMQAIQRNLQAVVTLVREYDEEVKP